MTINWDPFKDMMIVNEFFDPVQATLDKEKNCMWSPAVDVYETEKSIVLTAELPGVQSSEINLTIQDDVLLLKGERRFEKDVKQENYRVVERNYGHFSRRFTMPCEVDGEHVTAAFKDGILKVTIPKKTTSRKINVELTK